MDFRRNLFLVYKEMLHNVVKHAGASQVNVALTKSNGILRLEVKDDGRGFSTETVRTGTGLESMRSRAAELGGVLELKSAPEAGTTVRLSVRIP
jgi:signal transduction histidine kinase